MNGKEMMKRLEENVGKPVKIKYIFFGRTEEGEGILKRLKDFEEIEFEQSSKTPGGIPLTTFIPFVSEKHGIQKITMEDGIVIYETDLINEGNRTEGQVKAIMTEIFGQEVAEKLCSEKKVKATNTYRESGDSNDGIIAY